MISKNKIDSFLTDKRFLRIAVITAAAAVLIIFITSYTDKNNGTVEPDVYSTELRNQLLDIVSHIDGVGRAEIFLTMDNTGENVYMKNSDTKTKSIIPTVRGVVIVCDGGEDPVVVARVMSAVTRSLSISSDKVCITKLSDI